MEEIGSDTVSWYAIYPRAVDGTGLVKSDEIEDIVSNLHRGYIVTLKIGFPRYVTLKIGRIPIDYEGMRKIMKATLENPSFSAIEICIS